MQGKTAAYTFTSDTAHSPVSAVVVGNDRIDATELSEVILKSGTMQNGSTATAVQVLEELGFNQIRIRRCHWHSAKSNSYSYGTFMARIRTFATGDTQRTCCIATYRASCVAPALLGIHGGRYELKNMTAV
jgi:hypothetical protein